MREITMANNENKNNDSGKVVDRSVPLTEERGLPPVNETPPMPPVKPPQPDGNDSNKG